MAESASNGATRPSPEARATALVVGNYRPALTASRVLSKMGYRVVLGQEPGSVGAERSRAVDEVWALPPARKGPDALRQAFADRFRVDPSVEVVLPMTEGMLNRVSAVREAIPPGIRLACPQAHVISTCHDKYAWLRFCRDHGVPTPAFDTATTLGELREVVRTLGCPVVVRPVEAGKRIERRKAITIFHENEFDAAFPRWPDGLGSLLVQRRFEGQRFNVYFGAKDGEVVRELHSRSIRTDRWDGSGQTIDGEVIPPIPTHTEMVARVAAAFGYTGVGNAQFLHDAARGESCFLEINPRFGASYAFVEKAGFPLTRIAVELAGPEPDLPVVATGYPRTRFAWTYGDLSGLLFSLRNGDVSRAQGVRWAAAVLSSFALADVHVTWSWSDPVPTLVVYRDQLLRMARRR